MKERLAMYVARAGVVGSITLAVALLCASADLRAQGCVASRMEAPSCPSRNGLSSSALDTDGMSYHLPQGRWQASFGYRWFMSHRHFVGSIEQNAENVAKGTAERDRSTSKVINHTHIPAVGLSYGLTPRVSLSADLPIFMARRKSPANAQRPMDRTEARGIGDLNLIARYWVGRPNGHTPRNLSLGVGVKLPTGQDRLEDDFLVSVDPVTGVRTTTRRPVDQSIQPGDGAFGFVTDFQAFHSFGRVTAFASGSYLFNPKEQNDFLRDPANPNPDPTSAYLSIADQYAARAGIATSINRLGFSLGARLEGVPSSDVFGGDLGRRRPGYSIALEPSVSYSWNKNAVALSVPYLVRRVRTQNISDKLATERTGQHVQGDAAFADYVVIIGFSRRF
jgi:hypothetical protein